MARNSTKATKPRKSNEKTAAAALSSRINGFYRGFHNLEALVSNRILDHDVCPEDFTEPPVFTTRESALKELKAIIQEVDTLSANEVVNKDLLSIKLRGTAAYLRALLGERMDFKEYIQQTMGFVPIRIPDQKIQSLKTAAITSLRALHVAWKPKDLNKLFNGQEIEIWELARALYDHYLKVTPAVRNKLKLTALMDLRFNQEASDEWWDFWIKTERKQPTTLIINMSKKHNTTYGLRMGTHEITGHALHVAQLIDSATTNDVDSSALNITTHSCEAFHMEGLATALLELGIIPQLHLDPLTKASIALYHFNTALEYNLYLDFENGREPAEIAEEIEREAPFWGKNWLENAQARQSDPMNRAYLACYWPSYELFMKISTLQMDRRIELLRKLYMTLQTPSQIATLIAAG